MFEIDFMSSLKNGQVNGFDLAILEELEKEDEEKEEQPDIDDLCEEALDSDFYDE